MEHVSLAIWIRQLIHEDKLYKFYKTKDWLALRDEVMRENHYECAHCAEQGRYTRAVMVHHINEVKKRPDLALTKEYDDPITGERKRNLIPLCFACHEEEHDRFAGFKNERAADRYTNEERW